VGAGLERLVQPAVLGRYLGRTSALELRGDVLLELACTGRMDMQDPVRENVRSGIDGVSFQ